LSVNMENVHLLSDHSYIWTTSEMQRL